MSLPDDFLPKELWVDEWHQFQKTKWVTLWNAE
jgi:hypothetical protein